jgi:hypothetical protein
MMETVLQVCLAVFAISGSIAMLVLAFKLAKE